MDLMLVESLGQAIQGQQSDAVPRLGFPVKATAPPGGSRGESL